MARPIVWHHIVCWNPEKKRYFRLFDDSGNLLLFGRRDGETERLQIKTVTFVTGSEIIGPVLVAGRRQNAGTPPLTELRRSGEQGYTDEDPKGHCLVAERRSQKKSSRIPGSKEVEETGEKDGPENGVPYYLLVLVRREGTWRRLHKRQTAEDGSDKFCVIKGDEQALLSLSEKLPPVYSISGEQVETGDVRLVTELQIRSQLGTLSGYPIGTLESRPIYCQL